MCSFGNSGLLLSGAQTLGHRAGLPSVALWQNSTISLSPTWYAVGESHTITPTAEWMGVFETQHPSDCLRSLGQTNH